MLAVASLRNSTRDDHQAGEQIESFSVGGGGDGGFIDFSGDNLLESIDFDDIFDGMDEEHVLPALDVDSDANFFAEFSSSDTNTTSIRNTSEKNNDENSKGNYQDEEKDSNYDASSLKNQGEEIVSKGYEIVAAENPSEKEAEKGRKSSKNHQGNKRKVKVDWTPELHRRFVQAVEQLGVDKAVPSRILELMGIDCLTRHNIASHLQKYRSHRKHLLAREAEAASWSQRRQVYGAAAAGGGGCKGEMATSPWLARSTTTIGFPPPMAAAPPPPPPISHYSRPLHVWGHPSTSNLWPKHLSRSQSVPVLPIWPPPTPPLPPDTSFWHSSRHRHPSVLHSQTPGTPCFISSLSTSTRYPAPPVPGIPPHATYKVGPAAVAAPRALVGQTCPDFHPTKESIDAALGDVLSKPWLPLPLGLKPPSTDGVLLELHRQGVEHVPTSCA